MIKAKSLVDYPPPSVLDEALENAFRNAALLYFNDVPDRSTLLLAQFRTFLDITDRQLTYLEFLNKPQVKVMEQLVGFIYDAFDYRKNTAYNQSRRMLGLISVVFIQAGVAPPKLPKISTTADCQVDTCIAAYKVLTLNAERQAYYIGWKANSKDHKLVYWPLGRFYKQYGSALTLRYWEIFRRYTETQLSNTAVNSRYNIMAVLDSVCQQCKTEKELQELVSSEKINDFVLHIFSAQKLRVKEHGYSMKDFYIKWGARVALIKKLLIKPGLWSDPMYELYCPDFKKNTLNENTHRKVDELGTAFSEKLVTYVPLNYSDDQAINELLRQIILDIDHVVSACNLLASTIMKKYYCRLSLAKLGRVKKYIGPSRSVPEGSPDYADIKIPKNKCATWEYYNYDKPNKGSMSTFIDTRKMSFPEEYSLLGPYTLYPFLYLLVNEHQEITDSWLVNFELFDKNGKEYGYKQVGSSWVAISVKRRKGNKSAYQTIFLNAKSKSLLDNILELTQQARCWLREQGNDDWRFLLLGTRTGFSKPKQFKELLTFHTEDMKKSALGQAILKPSEDISATKAITICSNLSLTTMRASCGVRVYLQTLSSKAMSEALGHEFYTPKLLSRYLPGPILRYFQDRWVRIYQNALFYEAMQDSDRLFDVLDFGEGELEAFLNNHRLQPLPAHLMMGQYPESTVANDLVISKAVIPVSVLSLQIMEALTALVDDAPSSQSITGIAAEYYELSRYVLDGIDKGYLHCTKEIIEARSKAKAHPLDNKNLKRAVYAIS